ncbi:MAG: RsmB/NOP family class I SAM-dependent RNA methyltransferase, partial [Spirochaetales bacterium]|nr:RsmB/NOP family class I SAM-dependent RNA methyltransferase [Spirochaetales bacterium]
MNDFDTFYQSIYPERWPALKQALLAENSPVALSEGLRQPYYLDKASLYPVQLLDIRPGQHILDMCAAPGGKTLQIALALQGKGSLTANDRSADRRKRLRQIIADHLPEELAHIISVTSHDATRWGLYEQD